mgnify:CR=1 FL=1
MNFEIPNIFMASPMIITLPTQFISAMTGSVKNGSINCAKRVILPWYKNKRLAESITPTPSVEAKIMAATKSSMDFAYKVS